ncbi:MAG: hypothetical protein RL531_442 [Actinomycetota bacterium]|jgi:hypothetical protein
MPIRDRLEHLVQMFGLLHPAEQVELDRRRRAAVHADLDALEHRLAGGERTGERREVTAA